LRKYGSNHEKKVEKPVTKSIISNLFSFYFNRVGKKFRRPQKLKSALSCFKRMEKLKLIYVYDAHCSWCFAFSKVIVDIQKKYQTQFDFEVLSGGMIIGDRIGTIKDAAPPNILEIYERITSFTGTQFSDAYLANVKQGDSIRNSEIPANALAVFKSYLPQRAIEYAHALQHQLFITALEVNEEALYLGLAKDFGLDGPLFLEQMQQTEFLEAARYEFALAKQLQVTGYPQLLVQTAKTQFYLIAKGYTDFETLDERVQKVLAEIKPVK